MNPKFVFGHHWNFSCCSAAMSGSGVLKSELLGRVEISSSDIVFTSNRVFIPPFSLSFQSNNIAISTAKILFRLDSVTQERNETFRITFSDPPILPTTSNFRNSFEGVIVDATRSTFELSEECYREREGDTSVILTKDSDIFLANSVLFRIIPLTIDQAKEMGLNLMFPLNNLHSPVYADENDFNTSIIIATFSADEGSNRTNLSVPISVFDDETNEASEQFFAVAIEIFAAVNEDLISLGITASLCEIVDNDPIAIGFQFSAYDFYEPITGQVEIMNVTIVKNRVSEQTFGLVVTFEDPDAGTNAALFQQTDGQNNFDYIVDGPGINTLMTLFEPTQSEANFSFTIVSDSQAEGIEGFSVTISSQGEEFPNFMQSFEETSPYSQASIRIIDADDTSSNVLEISLGVAFGVVGSVALIVLIILCVCIARRFRGKRKHTNENRHLQVTVDGDTANEFHTVRSSLKLSVPKKFIVPSCRLKLVSTIGQGEFGMVYKGHIKSGYSDIITDTVAVKTLKGFVENESIKNLLKECGRMYTFDHPNILKLIGVCMDGGPAPYIIMPFMALGSLKDYLQKERDTLLLAEDHVDSELVVAVEKNLLDMCSQVAKGMEYLAKQRIVHRDLAARNCMIDLNFVIKVADFGLAESLDSTKDYFRQDQDNIVKLPIKWLALESIHDRIFSEKSDVWSFGVTCWEIFNGGKTPYPGIHPADLPLQLDQGLRLEKPKNAAVTSEIYAIMTNCWLPQSYSRPSFSEIVNQLSNLLSDAAGYLDLQAPKTLDTKL